MRAAWTATNLMPSIVTGPKSHRSFHEEISCRLERLSRERRAVSHGRLRRNNTDKDAPGLSLFLSPVNPDPNTDVQTSCPCEISGGLSDLIQKSRAHARSAFPIPRAANRCRAQCRGCPSLAARIHLPSREAPGLFD